MYPNNLFLLSCNEFVVNYYITNLTCFLILDRDKNLNNMGKLLIIFSKIDTFNRFLTIRGVFNRIQRIYLKKGVAFSPTGKIHTTGFQ